ncbi:MAG TPA: right-handed parallel beta-helix repeat-containing protein [Phototrophicaceae bacterium]|nr:right-handed parallel beta-helix repeat-containing protein [Phototrophicaceae bacterium]
MARFRFSYSILLLVSFFILSVYPHNVVRAADFVVNTVADDNDLDFPYPGGVSDGNCLTVAGKCSLRAAIQQANQSGGASIGFNIVGGSLLLSQSLPALLAPMTISGGGSAVMLDGALINSNYPAFDLTASGSTISNLSIINFGMGIRAVNSSNHTIAGNRLGVGADGNSPASRAGSDGIYLSNSSNNQIGGSGAAGNVISGYGNAAIYLYGGSDNLIQGNYLGTNISGTTSIENAYGITMSYNNIRTSVIDNVISGNRITGIVTSLSAGQHTIKGNRIGTNAAGTAALPNGEMGIMAGDNNVIGGPRVADRNIISGNGKHGIYLGANNTVLGNYIGVNLTAKSAIPNGYSGIYVGGNGSTIGGIADGEGNVVSGNTEYGIYIQLYGTTVQGNFIGTGASGTPAIGNGLGGILVSSENNTISHNFIAFNQANKTPTVYYGHGIEIYSFAKNAILGNTIFANEGLGIKFQNSYSNHNQAAPDLLSAVFDTNAVTVTGSLTSAASNTYHLEFFTNGECDPSGYGEGQIFLGTSSLTTEPDGTAALNVNLSSPLLAIGQFVTATITDPDGNTSEFSACTPVTNPAPGLTLVAPVDQSTTSNRQPTFTWNGITGATAYEIQLGRTNPPTEMVVETATTYVPPVPLLMDTYYWRVRVQGDTDWSETWSLTINAPTNAAPERNLITIDRPTLTWATVGWAEQYEIEISSSPTFAAGAVYYLQENVGNMLAYTVPEGQELADGVYYWHVRALAVGRIGAWSITEPLAVDLP